MQQNWNKKLDHKARTHTNALYKKNNKLNWVPLFFPTDSDSLMELNASIKMETAYIHGKNHMKYLST